MTKGYVQVYTGNGKGKTTASLGVALRSLAVGSKIYIGQFLKSFPCGGITALQAAASHAESGTLAVELYGAQRKVLSPFTDRDKRAARHGVASAVAALKEGTFDLVILDELNVALSSGLIDRSDFESLLAARHETTELILTGRGAPDYVIAAADLVTRMEAVRHYYDAGVKERKGIEL